jgi:hypothetical protein
MPDPITLPNTISVRSRVVRSRRRDDNGVVIDAGGYVVGFGLTKDLAKM